MSRQTGVTWNSIKPGEFHSLPMKGSLLKSDQNKMKNSSQGTE